MSFVFFFPKSRGPLCKTANLRDLERILGRPNKNIISYIFFPLFAMGLLDYEVDIVLARLEADFHDQPPNICVVLNHQVSLQCPITEYPCNAQPQSIPAMPNRRVSLQCPTAEYPCNAPPQNMFAMANRRVYLQCPTAEYPSTAQLQNIPCSAQPLNIPAAPNHQISL